MINPEATNDAGDLATFITDPTYGHEYIITSSRKDNHNEYYLMQYNNKFSVAAYDFEAVARATVNTNATSRDHQTFDVDVSTDNILYKTAVGDFKLQTYNRLTYYPEIHGYQAILNNIFYYSTPRYFDTVDYTIKYQNILGLGYVDHFKGYQRHDILTNTLAFHYDNGSVLKLEYIRDLVNYRKDKLQQHFVTKLSSKYWKIGVSYTGIIFPKLQYQVSSYYTQADYRVNKKYESSFRGTVKLIYNF